MGSQCTLKAMKNPQQKKRCESLGHFAVDENVQIAKNLEEAKYLVCWSSNSVHLLEADFSLIQHSPDQATHVKTAFKKCQNSKPFRWSKVLSPIKNDGLEKLLKYTIEFGEVAQTIPASGFAEDSPMAGTMNKTSVSCLFIKNRGLSGLSFYQHCFDL